MRVLQGYRVGAVQDAPRTAPDAQRHGAGPARRQDEMRSVQQAAGAILSCKPERHARVCSKLVHAHVGLLQPIYQRFLLGIDLCGKRCSDSFVEHPQIVDRH